jgi:lipoprotein-anchoring transpeptidase ErfK/SrfK
MRKFGALSPLAHFSCRDQGLPLLKAGRHGRIMRSTAASGDTIVTALGAPEQAQPREPRRPGLEGGDVREGGARPDIAPEAPPVVAFAHDFPGNSIVIDTGGRKLYYVLPDKRAYEYAISVGREGSTGRGRRPSAESRRGRIGTRPPRCVSAIRSFQKR